MELALFGGAPVRSKPYPEWPFFDGEEEAALVAALRSGSWGGYNSKVKEFETAFAVLHGVKHAVSCSNGTVALEVALRAAGVGCGDEVIVPPFTFVASATAILLCHGCPIFVDIDPVTLNLSPAAVEAAITPRTKAMVVVHFGGHPAEMDALTAIAKKHGVAIIEDCAHAHGAKWGGVPVGNFGMAGTFSFQAFKLITSGEGGMVLTNSEELADKVWANCNQGRRRTGAWFEHYTLGTNYRLTAFQAAILDVQLKRLPQQTKTRMANYEYLRERLQQVPGVRMQKVHAKVSDHPHYLVTLRHVAEEFEGVGREAVLRALKAEGIPALATYPHPLYRNPLFTTDQLPPCGCGGWKQAQEYKSLHLAESERACVDGIWLEQSVLLGSRADMDDIAEAYSKVRKHAAKLKEYEAMMRAKTFLGCAVMAVLAAALAVMTVHAQTTEVPWNFTEEFNHGIPGWVSYPLAQDQGYDPTIYTSEVAGRATLVRDVIEEGQRTVRVGMLQPIRFYATPQTVVRVRYGLALCGSGGRMTLTVGATSGARYSVTLPATAGEHEVAVSGAQFKMPAAGAEAETLVLEAQTSGSVPGAHNRLMVSEVKIEAERPQAAAIAQPALAGRADVNTLVANEVVHVGSGALRVGLKGAGASGDVELFDGSGAEAASGKTGAVISLGANAAPGLWHAVVKTGVGESEFRFLVVGAVPAHPRLLLTPERLEQLRTGMPSDVLTKAVQARAASLAAQMTYNAKAGDSIELLPKESLLTGLKVYSALIDLYGNAIVMNALDYRLRGSPESLAATRRALLTVAQWPTWTPPWFAAHGLHTYYQTGVFSQRLAFGYDLIADALTPQEKAQVAQAFYEKSIAPTVAEYFENERMPLGSSNHEAHSVGGAIAMCAAVYGDVPQPQWDAQFGPAMAKLMVDYEELLHGLFPGDGSEREPAGYQDFAMEGMTMGAATMHRMGIHPKGMEAMFDSFWWPKYAEYTPGYVLDTGDFSGPLLARSGFAWQTELTKNPELRAFYDAPGVHTLAHYFASNGNAKYLPDMYDLICCTTPAATAQSAVVPASRIFPLRGSAALRSRWQEGATVVSLRVGPWFNHEHDDNGSFQLAAKGEVLIGEAGYTDYYTDPHYQDYFTQAAGHNTVLVDGDAFSQWGYDADAWKSFSSHPALTQHVLGEGVDYLRAEMTPAYGGVLASYTREYLFLKPRLLVVHDVIRADAAHTYSFLLHVPVGAEAKVNGIGATIVQPKAAAFVLAAGGDEAWKMEATPVPIHEYVDFDKQPVEQPEMLRLDSAKERAAMFTVGVNVGASGSLQEIKTTNAVGISADGGKTMAIFRNGAGYLTAGALATDGDALATTSENSATRIFAAQAHWLRVDDRTELSATTAADMTMSEGVHGERCEFFVPKATVVTIKAHGPVGRVMVDGKLSEMTITGGVITMDLPAGEHSVEISYVEISG